MPGYQYFVHLSDLVQELINFLQMINQIRTGTAYKRRY